MKGKENFSRNLLRQFINDKIILISPIVTFTILKSVLTFSSFHIILYLTQPILQFLRWLVLSSVISSVVRDISRYLQAVAIFSHLKKYWEPLKNVSLQHCLIKLAHLHLTLDTSYHILHYSSPYKESRRKRGLKGHHIKFVIQEAQ